LLNRQNETKQKLDTGINTPLPFFPSESATGAATLKLNTTDKVKLLLNLGPHLVYSCDCDHPILFVDLINLWNWCVGFKKIELNNFQQTSLGDCNVQIVPNIMGTVNSNIVPLS
jgi:hypothetical protein